MASSTFPLRRSLRVLVTGAFGLVGRELCGVLAERGHSVAALIHRNAALARNDGAPIAAGPFGTWPEAGKVAVLQGDVVAEQLGLQRGLVAPLTSGLDVIVHCAALTAFNLETADYERVNLGGVERVLDFVARAGRPVPVLHVSTAYVCGDQDGIVPEAATAATRFANGYEASKAAGETLMLQAHRRGQPLAIARPSIVVGRWDDGVIGEFGNLYQLIRLVTEGRIRVLPALAGASLDMVPIDHVAGALVDIAERMEAADGRFFHLASGQAVPVAALRPLAQAFPHMHAPRFVPPDQFDPARLSLREQRWNGQVTELYASYLLRGPQFATANLRALSGRVCPPTDAPFLRRMIAYGIEAGFLPRSGVAAALTAGVV